MYIRAKIKGNSMLPLFDTDSLVQIDLCPIEELHRGDIVVFKEGEGLICHRFFSMAKIRGELFLKVKGDAVWNFDPLVDSKYFLGKVVYLNKLGIRVRLDNFPARILGLFFSRIAPVYTRIHSSRFFRLPHRLGGFLHRGGGGGGYG
jgi:hypothetical protein